MLNILLPLVNGVVIKNGETWSLLDPNQKCFGLYCKDGKHSAVYLCIGKINPTTPTTPTTATTTTATTPTTATTTTTPTTTTIVPSSTTTSTTKTPTTHKVTINISSATTSLQAKTIKPPTSVVPFSGEGSGFNDQDKYYKKKSVIFDGWNYARNCGVWNWARLKILLKAETSNKSS